MKPTDPVLGAVPPLAPKPKKQPTPAQAGALVSALRARKPPKQAPPTEV